MTTLTMQLPEDVFAAVRSAPRDFLKDMRLAAADILINSGLVPKGYLFRLLSFRKYLPADPMI